MYVKPSQAIAGRFTISDPAADGALSDADSLPTGALLENGDVDAAVTVTVSNISTGIYKWSCTLPSDYTAGTAVAVQITGVLNANNIAGVVAEYVVDTQFNDDICGTSYVEANHALDQHVTAADNADAVWDELLSGHTTAGTFGLMLDTTVSSRGTDSGTADSVWDELGAGHVVSGSFGERLDATVTSRATAAAAADAVWDEAKADHTVSGSTGEAMQDRYWAKIVYVGGATTDKYRAAIFYKNDDPVDSGVTSPTIEVFSADDGVTLINQTAMVEAGSSHAFRYDATGSNLATEGEAYVVVIRGVIDGESQIFKETIIGAV